MARPDRILGKTRCCSICGAKIWMKAYNEENRLYNLMKKQNLCGECAFWIELIQYPPSNIEVISGICYRIHPFIEKAEKSMWLGGKGKVHYYLRSNLSVLKSNDVWRIGKVPERFKENFPDTLTEISQKAFNSLYKKPKLCKARACLDRYACFRYKLELEAESGPFNSIPKNWKAGGEHCRFFIPHQEISIDKSSV